MRIYNNLVPGNTRFTVVRQGFKPLPHSESRLKLRSCTNVIKLFRNGLEAHSTRTLNFCGTGILPVADNGARCELKTDCGL
jgi:hypothetical protein